MKLVKEFYGLRLGLVVGDGGHFLELDGGEKGVGYTLTCRMDILGRDMREWILLRCLTGYLDWVENNCGHSW